MQTKLGLSVFGWMIAALLVGCQAPGVGDPCEPEQVPQGGFDMSESYVETSSVQCRTRVCLVYQLEGDPREECDPTVSGSNCADQADIEERVYCTCRCRAPEDPTARLCDCPDGFDCKDILELGGPGIRGGYCVRSGTDRNET